MSGDYFQVMGVPLIKGRVFDPTDTATSRQVVLVSQSAARQFWPGSDPIGSKVRFRLTGMNYDAEVVGIVGDVRHEALDQPAAAEVFVPYSQSGFYALTFVVRAAPGSPANLQVLKEQIWGLDPLQSIFNSARLDHLISKTLIGQRFNLFVLGGFALATLLLASAGVYGVMSFFTSQRTREFGVRLALGAERRDIVKLVLGEGLKLAVAGVVARRDPGTAVDAAAGRPALRRDGERSGDVPHRQHSVDRGRGGRLLPAGQSCHQAGSGQGAADRLKQRAYSGP